MYGKLFLKAEKQMFLSLKRKLVNEIHHLYACILSDKKYI